MKDWQKAAARFEKEIGTLKRLEGVEGIIQVKDMGKKDGLPWYVMEYIDGSEIVQGTQNMAYEEKVDVLRALVKALARAHKQGIVHLDLKPSNILLRHGKEPVILDFGIAKVIQIAWNSISMRTGRHGTPRYMSPEQLNSGHAERENDAKTDEEKDSATASQLYQADIWALGVIIYEVLVERHPLGLEQKDTYNEMVKKILYNPVEDLSSFEIQDDRGLRRDRALAEICHTALSKNREERYKNGMEMAAALDNRRSSNSAVCIKKAMEYIQYKHWEDATENAIEAHAWDPYHPDIKECIEKAFSGKYGVPVSAEWVRELSNSLLVLYQKSAKPDFPCNLSKVRYIHHESPYFVVVDEPPGILLREFLYGRKLHSDKGILEAHEVLRFLEDIGLILDYLVKNQISLQGLDERSIYCLADEVDSVERFYFKGVGWKGEKQDDSLTVIRQIVLSVLHDSAIPLKAGMRQAFENSKTILEMMEAVRSMNREKTSMEEIF